MSFKCSLGLHNWDNCKCTKCGKIRDGHHVFTEDCEKCSVCGTVIENRHDWTQDCQKCSKCGKTREQEHHWINDCEKCSACGKTRHDAHKLVDGICTICGNGTFTSKKSGSTYKVKKIGDQVIMTENFKDMPDSGNFWAYENDEKNIIDYGYLYDWETAKALAPEGWHLPTKEEWETLHDHFGKKDKTVFEHLKHGGDSGFEGLYGGWRNVRGTFNSKAASGHFWSCTEVDEEKAYQFNISTVSNHAELGTAHKEQGLSIRYFRD